MANLYTLNGTNITTQWGVKVERCSGHLDMPKRKGETEYSWLDENGVEHYTEAADIRWDARDITLHCFIQATSKANFLTQLNSFKAELIQAGLQTLYIPTTGTTHSVYFREGFKLEMTSCWNGTYYIGRFILVLREPSPTVPS